MAVKCDSSCDRRQRFGTEHLPLFVDVFSVFDVLRYQVKCICLCTMALWACLLRAEDVVADRLGPASARAMSHSCWLHIDARRLGATVTLQVSFCGTSFCSWTERRGGMLSRSPGRPSRYLFDENGAGWKVFLDSRITARHLRGKALLVLGTTASPALALWPVHMDICAEPRSGCQLHVVGCSLTV